MSLYRLLVCVLLTGCASMSAPQYVGAEDPDVSAGVDRRAAREAIAVCHGYGCASTHLVNLTAEWPAIQVLFDQATDAALERGAVAKAVGLFEQAAGRQIGTATDRPRTTFSINDPSQLDCVDESINTTSFLHLLAREGLLRWHAVAEPARRFAFMMFGVHFTAVLVDKSGARYAVDSWFHENGVPAEIVELERWRAHWEPRPAASPNEAARAR